MYTQVVEQIIVNAPAKKVWRILADDFDKVGLCSSGIRESFALENTSSVDGHMASGRVCLSDGFGGDVTEQFTYYDEQNMRFGYKAIGDLPLFFKNAENNWRVQALEPNKAVVAFRAKLEMAVFPGVFLLLFKPIIRRVWGTRTLEELKYFVEHDQPHPRKQKIQNTQMNTV